MHAFIVRPFGTKKAGSGKEINFNRVEEELIAPALDAVGFSGRTTGEIVQQGNIRTDMFELLLIADLVIADISIHNANAFYELGIRHAFRDKRTFLIKSRGDDVPFDLKTDRYFTYDHDNPAASLGDLIRALKATWDSQKQDSPIFQLLPGLEPTDPNKFLVVPFDFQEEVEQARADKACGRLQMLAAETEGFSWQIMGLRLIGNAQFELRDWAGARATWERVRDYEAMDLEANTLLGTIFQRGGNLVKSSQALTRALENRGVSSWNRAEIQALMARNAKTQWDEAWKILENLEDRQEAALISPHLEQSLDLYCKGFLEDRNHFYSGLNALAMVTMLLELAKALPGTWEEGYELPEEAALVLKKYVLLQDDLTAGVKLAIASKRSKLERDGEQDIWAEISAADLIFLSSRKPKRVARAYQKALVNAPDFAIDVVRRQFQIYRSLGILADNTEAVLASLPVTPNEQEYGAQLPKVILFTGHRIDAANRAEPRFPADKEEQARAMIMEAVTQIKQKTDKPLLGISGGANGGDILFHEVCQALDIPSEIFLVLPKNEYIKASVADGGPDWVERFKALVKHHPTHILSDSRELPRWLRQRPDYSIWERSNLWMLHNALHRCQDDLTLVALWDGKPGDKPGGTADMVNRAQARGATFIHLSALQLQ